jgi:flagellar basal-body rod protein FlgB
MDVSATNSKLLLNLLSATSLRAKVLANNIANQNVPGYKRQDVKFEDLLTKELGRGGDKVQEILPEVVTDLESKARADGNNVDMEVEMTSLRENRLLYELYAGILSGQARLTQAAIHGDR